MASAGWMTAKVHEFDAREGGVIRVSLTYLEPTGKGKTNSHTDTYHGRFIRLVPNLEIVEVDEFETTRRGPLKSIRLPLASRGRLEAITQYG